MNRIVFDRYHLVFCHGTSLKQTHVRFLLRVSLEQAGCHTPGNSIIEGFDWVSRPN